MRNPLRWPSHIQILVALISGAAVGPLLAGEQGLIGPALGEGLAQVGQLFLSALKMLVIPLIMASIIAGLNQEGSRSPMGRMG